MTLVSIASYDDPDTVQTITRMRDKAAGDLRIVCVVQTDSGKLLSALYRANVEVIATPRSFAQGCAWPRWRAMQEYAGESYFFQCDAHMGFGDHWDARAKEKIDLLEAQGVAKPVLSGYYSPSGRGYKKKDYRYDENLWFVSPDFEEVVGATAPYPQMVVSGANVFTRGTVCEDAPPILGDLGHHVDQELWSVQLWTAGYDIYFSDEMLVWHDHRLEDHSPWHHYAGGAWARAQVERNRVVPEVYRGQRPDVLGDVRSLDEWKRFAEPFFIEPPPW